MSAPTGRRGRPALAWGLAAAGAAVLAATLVLVPRDATPPTGTEAPPVASATATPTPIPTATPALASPGATPGLRGILDHDLIYAARVDLPPIGRHVDGVGTGATMEARIRSRVEALDPVNVHVNTVAIQGDLTTVDLALAGRWNAPATDQTTGLVQQLVYTATEEPSIRRVAFTQNGARLTGLGAISSGASLSREQVSGYGDADRSSVSLQGDATGPLDLVPRWTVEETAPALARLTVETGVVSGPIPGALPSLVAEVRPNDEAVEPDLAKWVLRLRVIGARPLLSVGSQSGTNVETRKVDKTPLRSVRTTRSSSTTAVDFELGLDDLRPWRVAVAFSPVRIFVDVGGPPATISGPNAVYTPLPDAHVDRVVKVSGVASATEANVRLRVRDGRGAVVLSTFTTASHCCNPGGTFDTTLQLPPSLSGAASVEVFEESQRDGSDVNLIRVPICVLCPPPTPSRT